MVNMRAWSTLTDEKVGQHHLQHLTAEESDLPQGVAWAAAAVPGQYASPQRIAGILEKLGKDAAAKYIEHKLPAGTRARSGDLGEILGSTFAGEELGYLGITRLRWKDHREMAMRGEDIIGVKPNGNHTVEFLKGEIKSRVRLGKATVEEADFALRKDRGRPSPHALEFIADRLHEDGEDELGGLIDKGLLVTGLAQRQVVHLLFTFPGNDPRSLLRNNLKAYSGRIRQFAVGIQIPDHQEFISAVYNRVISNGRKR